MTIVNKALEKESAILDYFRNLDTKNPKKIKKLAQKLYFEAQHDLQRKMCHDIMQSPNPYKTITNFMGKIDDFVILSKQFIEDGYHGMIFTGDNGDIVYPVNLDTFPHWLNNPDDLWNEEDEREIQLEIAKTYTKSITNKRVLVKVVLFQDFGFSGLPHIFELENQQ